MMGFTCQCERRYTYSQGQSARRPTSGDRGRESRLPDGEATEPGGPGTTPATTGGRFRAKRVALVAGWALGLALVAVGTVLLFSRPKVGRTKTPRSTARAVKRSAPERQRQGQGAASQRGRDRGRADPGPRHVPERTRPRTAGNAGGGPAKGAPKGRPKGAGRQKAARELTPEELFRAASPAVVEIVALDEDDKEICQGSGFFVRPGKGSIRMPYVVTNYHVIRSAVSAKLRCKDKTTATSGFVCAEDESADLALLPYSPDPPGPYDRKPPGFLDIERAPMPAIGSKVFTIGSPKGLEGSLSDGLVSGHRERERGGGKWIQPRVKWRPPAGGQW